MSDEMKSDDTKPESVPVPPEPVQQPLASRSDFLGSTCERRYREVTLPISGKRVRIQSLSELERARYEAALIDGNGRRIAARVRDQRARLICLCLVDERGDRLLHDTDVDAVLARDSHDDGYLYDQIFDLVGLANPGVEDAVKN